jgi:hypothetical protein
MVRKILLMAATITLIGASPALAGPPERQGIENSKKAGIYVDPLIEPYMAEAPIGSCVNDPSQEDCPKVKAIVYAPEFFSIPEDQRPKTATSSSNRKRAERIVARAAAWFNCGLKLVRDSPYKAAGYEQMDGQNMCFEPIQDLDVYMALDKYYSYQWNTMTNRWFYPTNPNQYPWSGSLRYACTATPHRHWRARMDAYVVYKGVWYGGSTQATGWDYCG